MAAARAKARSGEAGAQCHRAPGPPPRPKPRRTARRRCADTLTAQCSRLCAGGRRAGAGADRARCRAPRAAVLGDECARGALFKGEQGSTRAAAVTVAVATAEPGGGGGSGAQAPAFERAWHRREASADATPSYWKLWGAGWNLRVISVDAEARDTQCACVRSSRAPFESLKCAKPSFWNEKVVLRLFPPLHSRGDTLLFP